MSDKNMARRAGVEISFDGIDITKSITPYLLSMTYTDNEEDEADDLQIRLQDREGIWLESWLGRAIDAATNVAVISGGKVSPNIGLRINAVIVKKNFNSDGNDVVVDCGQFELDSVDSSGPPAVISIKATALPFTSQIRQTKVTKAWENYTLRGIAEEMAAENGMSCMYLSDHDVQYRRVEQYATSNIAFLQRLCHAAGISLKVTNNIIVLFDQASYESANPVLTIQRGDKSYTRWKVSTSEADNHYSSCRVRWTTSSGKLIEGVAKIEDYDPDSAGNQQLELKVKVSSIAEAQVYAEKMLRLHNKFQKIASFTIPGNPTLSAGLTVNLKEWGTWSGKYIIKQVRHNVGDSFTTQIELRKVLEGY